ncbi:ERCC4 domain-containing protein [bacterium]|nr:ERCC4 domain-containing protein [bacterium]
MNELIVVDTREKKNKKILQYFDKNSINYIVSKLNYGDYMLYKDNSVVIDRKNNLLELAHNLCNTLEHERINREITRAKQDGCKKFVFLISESKIKSIEDIINWSSPHTKVKGETLLKIMSTMKKKYDIHFIICSKKNISQKIVELLFQK